MNLKTLFGPVILVFQMPKAASQTIEATLQVSSLPHEIIRTHSLSRNQAAELRRRANSGDVDPGWKQNALDRIKATARLRLALRGRRFFVACGARIPKLQVLTAVRDILSAGLSTIFQNYQLYVPSPELLTPEKCHELLCRPRPCAYYRDWFDVEFRPHTGIDVYASAFPVDTKSSVYENRFVRALLYRFDILPQVPALLQQFLGTRIQGLVDKNLTSSKAYALTFSQVKSELRLPEEFVVEQLNTRFMQHFYSAPERDSIQLQWTGQASRAAKPNTPAVQTFLAP